MPARSPPNWAVVGAQEIPREPDCVPARSDPQRQRTSAGQSFGHKVSIAYLKAKAAEDCRTPRRFATTIAFDNPKVFGVRQSSAAFRSKAAHPVLFIPNAIPFTVSARRRRRDSGRFSGLIL